MVNLFKTLVKILISYPDQKLYKYSDEIVIKKLKDENFPYLVSFPRTGSHWLRNIMELYFKRPSLMRVFYYGYKNNFLCYHTHDIEDNYKLGKKKCKRLIYLYRNPVDTVFSQLNYYGENLNDTNRIIFWSKLYADHISKWYLSNHYSEEVIAIKYERLKHNPVLEFGKVCDFFGEKIDKDKIQTTLKRVTKDRVKNSTNDKKVVNTSSTYDELRKRFIKDYSKLVLDSINQVHPSINKLFDD